MPDHDPLTDHRSKRKGCIIAAIALALVIAISGGFFGWRLWQTSERALRIAEKFQQALNFTPEVRVNSRVVVNATTPILELATVQKQLVVQHNWSHTWLHSTKSIELEATFTARAGYDLQRPFYVSINTREQTMSAQLPPAKILSIGMSDVRIKRDEDGLWNKLSAADREEALGALEATARRDIHQTDILREARAEGEKRIRQLLESTTGKENLRWIDLPPKP